MSLWYLIDLQDWFNQRNIACFKLKGFHNSTVSKLLAVKVRLNIDLL